MALILEFDLDMVKLYHYTKNEVFRSTASNVIAWTDTQTETQTNEHYEIITSTAHVILILKNESSSNP